MSIFLAAALKPFVQFAWLCFVAAVVISIRKWWPEGRVKRLLLLELWSDDDRRY